MIYLFDDNGKDFNNNSKSDMDALRALSGKQLDMLMELDWDIGKHSQFAFMLALMQHALWVEAIGYEYARMTKTTKRLSKKERKRRFVNLASDMWRDFHCPDAISGQSSSLPEQTDNNRQAG